MSKILFKLVPLLDHLYIFQVLEYNSFNFLKWFLNNPLKRDLQKKHKISWTNKAILLFLVSLILIIVDTGLLSWKLFSNLWFTPIFVPLKAFFSPFFLIASQLLISPLEYYQKQKILNLAREKLSKIPNLKVVAITGSFGKTSTKDIIYTLLWKKYYVVKTPKSFNTPLGVAQTILEDIKQNTQIFIAEVGAYKRGEIKKIAKLINPEIGIITAIAPQHLQRFGSIENIALAKFELPQSLKKSGKAILNSNFEYIKRLANTINSQVIFYGSENNPFYATDININVNGTNFTMYTPKGKVNINIPLIGEHHVQNFLAATATSLSLGLTLKEIKERARLLLPTPHRMEIKKLGNITLIDNSYNTNPKSAKSSLQLLNKFEKSRKIVITPGFVELGKEAQTANREFGHDLAYIADHIIIVGENAQKDLLEGIKQVLPEEPEYSTHLVSSTKEGLSLAQKLAQDIIKQVARDDIEVVVLLENDLPDQYF